MSFRTAAAIADFTEMMHSLLEAGYTLNDAIRLIAGNDLSPAVVAIASQLAEGIRRGCGFSLSLKTVHTPAGSPLFPDDYIAWFAGMERTGNLAGAFSAQRSHLAAARETRENLYAALAYPAFIVLISLFGTAALLLKALPWMTERGLLDASGRNSMLAGVVASLSVLLVLALAFCLFVYRLTGRISDESLLFSHLADYARAGLPVSDAISPCLPFIGSRRRAASLIVLKRDIGAGKPLARSFLDTGMFPSFVTDMMLVSGSTGNLASVFDRAAGYYANRDGRRRALAARVSEPVAIGITGIYLSALLESALIPLLSGIGGIF